MKTSTHATVAPPIPEDYLSAAIIVRLESAPFKKELRTVLTAANMYAMIWPNCSNQNPLQKNVWTR